MVSVCECMPFVVSFSNFNFSKFSFLYELYDDCWVCRPMTGNSAWSFPTYGVFGDECLQNSVKHDHHKASYFATTIAESSPGATVLSITLADIIDVLGPIQDVLSRISNLKNLRCSSEYSAIKSILFIQILTKQP